MVRSVIVYRACLWLAGQRARCHLDQQRCCGSIAESEAFLAWARCKTKRNFYASTFLVAPLPLVDGCTDVYSSPQHTCPQDTCPQRSIGIADTIAVRTVPNERFLFVRFYEIRPHKIGKARAQHFKPTVLCCVRYMSQCSICMIVYGVVARHTTSHRHKQWDISGSPVCRLTDTPVDVVEESAIAGSDALTAALTFRIISSCSSIHTTPLLSSFQAGHRTYVIYTSLHGGLSIRKRCRARRCKITYTPSWRNL